MVAATTTGTAWCPVCTLPSPPGAAACPRCGTPLATPDGVGGLPTLLAGAVPARPGSLAAAGAVDGVAVVAGAAPLILGVAWSEGTLVALGAVAVLAVVGGSLAAHWTSGRTLGRLALGLRTVDLFSGLPLGLHGTPAERWTGSVTLDVRRGRDTTRTTSAAVAALVARVAAELPRATAVGYGGVAAPSAAPAAPPAPPAPPVPQAPAAFQAPQPPLPAAASPGPVAPAPAPLPVAAPAPPPAPAAPRPTAPPAAAPPAAPPAAAPATAPHAGAALTAVVLTFDDGRRVEVQGRALVGRAPQPIAGESVDTLIPVTDLSRSISKTHAALRWDGRVLWVADRGSTNGTVVVDGVSRYDVGGVEHPAPPGARVELGDRSFVVGRGGVPHAPHGGPGPGTHRRPS